MKLEKLFDLPNGNVTYLMGDFVVCCIPSQNGIWHIGHFDRRAFDSIRENTILLLRNESFQFAAKVGVGFSVKSQCISDNGTFAFSVHRDPDADMAAIIVMNSHHEEIFRLNTTTHLTSCSLSESGEYLALSFSRSRNKDDHYSNRLEVINLETGEVTSSLCKGNDLMYSDVIVMEPFGNVIAFNQGKSFKVC
ncbi:hypothetical protein [Lonsdalea quercina]|uniref:hypothetical protein n=1 Tax=Lonsdalea quercina TaxID=71657 RepID=UPI003975E4E8